MASISEALRILSHSRSVLAKPQAAASKSKFGSSPSKRVRFLGGLHAQDLSDLVGKGVLKQVGAGRGSHYVLLRKRDKNRTNET